jgi:hypothetical protein
MKRKIHYLSIFSIILFTSISCNNDLDVLADYKEISVVYGLLNPTKTSNYIRIERAYLGEGNALVMAQNPDSIYYDTSAIEVSLIYKKSTLIIDTLALHPSFDIPKNEGLFTDDDYLLYKLSNTVLDRKGQYEFVLHNKVTGYRVTSTTNIIGSIIQLTLFPSTKVNFASNDPYVIKIFSANYGKQYGLITRFNYIEYSNNYQDTVKKQLDYYLDDIKSITTNGTEELRFLVDGESFYRYLGSRIPVNPNVVRPFRDVNLDFIFTAGTDDLNNYIQINQPGNTVDYVPEYSNLSDGKGIFSCKMDTTVFGIRMNSQSIDSLVNGQYTKDLF